MIQSRTPENQLRLLVVHGFYGHPSSSQMHHGWSLLFSAYYPMDFRNVLFNAGLQGMGSVGPRCTWYDKQDGNDIILERLDRKFCNDAFKDLFPNATVYVKSFGFSDHCQLFTLSPLRWFKSRFHFEEYWLSLLGCKESIESNWGRPTVAIYCKYQSVHAYPIAQWH